MEKTPVSSSLPAGRQVISGADRRKKLYRELEGVRCHQPVLDTFFAVAIAPGKNTTDDVVNGII